MPLPFIVGALIGAAVGYLVGSAIEACASWLTNWFSSGQNTLSGKDLKAANAQLKNAIQTNNFERVDIGLGDNQIGTLKSYGNYVQVTEFDSNLNIVKGTILDDADLAKHVRENKTQIVLI